MSKEFCEDPARIIDGLLILMRETPGWDGYLAVDAAFEYLDWVRNQDPSFPLTVSVADELRRRNLI